MVILQTEEKNILKKEKSLNFSQDTESPGV